MDHGRAEALLMAAWALGARMRAIEPLRPADVLRASVFEAMSEAEQVRARGSAGPRGKRALHAAVLLSCEVVQCVHAVVAPSLRMLHQTAWLPLSQLPAARARCRRRAGASSGSGWKRSWPARLAATRRRAASCCLSCVPS